MSNQISIFLILETSVNIYYYQTHLLTALITQETFTINEFWGNLEVNITTRL